MKWQGRRQSTNVTVRTPEQNAGSAKSKQRYDGGMNANRLINPESIEYVDEGSAVERNLKKQGVLNPANKGTKAFTARPVTTDKDNKFFKHTEKDLK
jgi:hypothetical protein